MKIIKSILRSVLLDKAELIVEAGLNAQKQFATKCFKRIDRRRKAYVYEGI